MFRALAVVCLAVAAFAIDVTFKDCGSEQGSVDGVSVDPCDNADRCTLQVGSTYTVGVKFTPSAEITSGELTGVAIVFGSEVPLPLPEPDLCKLISCPAKAGEQLSITQQFPIDSTFPQADLDLKVAAADQDGKPIACGQVSLSVKA